MSLYTAGYPRRWRDNLICFLTAEDLIFKAGNIGMDTDPSGVIFNVSGRHHSGTHINRDVCLTDIDAALVKPIREIVTATIEVLSDTPETLSGDIIKRGGIMLGGGALTRKLRMMLERETNLPFRVVDNPLTAVAEGMNMLLKMDRSILARVAVATHEDLHPKK